METIIEAKAHLRANFEKGVDCACCGQYVKLYKRKLNSGMALFLIGLYRLSVSNMTMFFSNHEVMAEMKINTSSLDYSVMKHFGLIYTRISEAGKKDSGKWMITSKGVNLLLGQSTSPKHVFLYNNKRQGFSDETITIKEALGSKFDFDELMKG
jgi:hypothetical protein